MGLNPPRLYALTAHPFKRCRATGFPVGLQPCRGGLITGPYLRSFFLSGGYSLYKWPRSISAWPKLPGNPPNSEPTANPPCEIHRPGPAIRCLTRRRAYGRPRNLPPCPPMCLQAFIAAEDKRFYTMTARRRCPLRSRRPGRTCARRDVSGRLPTITQRLIQDLVPTIAQTSKRQAQEIEAFGPRTGKKRISQGEVLSLY